MSGGAYDYVFSHISRAAEDVAARHRDKPHVLAFAALLRRCSDVMYAIEWADSGDTAWNEALDAQIRAVVHPGEDLAASLTLAETALTNLQHAILRGQERGA